MKYKCGFIRCENAPVCPLSPLSICKCSIKLSFHCLRVLLILPYLFIHYCPELLTLNHDRVNLRRLFALASRQQLTMQTRLVFNSQISACLSLRVMGLKTSNTTSSLAFFKDFILCDVYVCVLCMSVYHICSCSAYRGPGLTGRYLLSYVCLELKQDLLGNSHLSKPTFSFSYKTTF